jgi:NADH-quinone oxidoreductase subunit J
VAVALGLGLVAEVATAVRLGVGLSGGSAAGAALARTDNVRALADVLFSSYFFPFEATSLLLIVAAVGVMLLGRRHPTGPRAGDGPADPDGGAPAARSEMEPVP